MPQVSAVKLKPVAVGVPTWLAVLEHAVAGHSDVVGRRVPRKRNGRLADSARREARRRGGRGRIRAGSRGDALGRGAGDVACCIDCGNSQRVGGRTGEARVAEAGGAGGSDLRAALEEPVAGDGDVVGGSRPRKSRGGRGDRTGHERRRGGGGRRIRASSCRDALGGGAGNVARCIDGDDPERVGRATREAGVTEARGGGSADLAAVLEEPVAADGDVVGRGRPREGRGGCADGARREPGRGGRRDGVRAGSRGDALRRGAGDVAGGVHGRNSQGVGRLAGEPGVVMARGCRGADLAAVLEEPVAADGDVVGGSRPREGGRGCGDCARRKARRRGGWRRVGTGSGCDIRRRDAGDIACCIDCGHAERVGRAAGQCGEAEARSSGRPDLAAILEHAVAGHSDVVGRRVPRKRNGRLADRARGEARRRRGWGGVRAGGRGDALRGDAGDVARCIGRGDAEGVGRRAGQPRVGVVRRRRGVDLRAAPEHSVLGDRGVVARRGP